MASSREDYGATQNTKSEGSSDSYRQEICELARLYATRGSRSRA